MRESRAETEFTAFVQGAGTRLERAAVLLTGDRLLAEDLLQVTYAKVYLAWKRVEQDPLAYARTTLLHVYISHRRLRRNAEVPTEIASRGELPATDGDAARRLDVLDALATLSALKRAVVVLRYWEDRSVADTAVDLGLTESVVKTRARRALGKLRPLLELDERTPS
ncbi:MAG TPA: SigE family RNA polymerase sigma factor [Nocardioides sp.]|uniref:SigE family RNA polymerase sigma factor n=1 Tax=Nocardioides sp. TaxID=35761 RepID=UPI002F40C1C8